MLTSLLLTPFVGALVILAIPGNYRVVIRTIALLTSLATALKAVSVFAAFQPGVAGLQFAVQQDWIPSAGIGFHLGLDGLNVGLVLMTGIVAFAAVAISQYVEERAKLYYFLLLVVTGGALGAFLSLDLFFLYFFNELALAPTFILMGIWGRGETKTYATFQMAMYLTLGALAALVGLAALYSLSGAYTLDAPTLSAYLAQKPMPVGAQALIFPLLLFGFGALAGLFPFHSWAAPGYAAAPTAAAMIHAGVLKKVGLYALLRAALPLMPGGVERWSPVLAVLAAVNITYCGWVAMRQSDLALLLGNSSLAHMGFCFLGLASASVIGITGVTVIMVAHGLLAALEFAILGHVQRATGTSDMTKLGGLLRPMPFIGAAATAAFMAGCGLPGFANFAGEATVLFGAWRAFPAAVTVAAWGGLVIGAVYMLRTLRAVFHGPTPPALAAAPDAGTGFETAWRRLPYLALLAALIYFGVFPDSLASRIRPAAEETAKAANLLRPGKSLPAVGPLAAAQQDLPTPAR